MSIVRPEQRGEVTPEASAIWEKLTGRELTQSELSILPFLQSRVINGGLFTAASLGRERLQMMQRWQDAGLLEFGPAQSVSFNGDHVVAFTAEFWDCVSAVLWETSATKSVRKKLGQSRAV